MRQYFRQAIEMGINLFLNNENPGHTCCIDAQDTFDLIDEHRLDRSVFYFFLDISRVDSLEPLTAEPDHPGHPVPSLRVTVNFPATRPLAAAVFSYEKKRNIRDTAAERGFCKTQNRAGNSGTKILTTLRAAL